MTKKQTKISSTSYQNLLKKIREKISQTQGKIFTTTTRYKVEMAWEIGREVDKHLAQNTEKNYGKNLLKMLERDVAIAHSTLYKMHRFYKSYKTLPKNDEHLNWSHYRVLAGIKSSSQRKYLENLARENFWDSGQLQLEVSKVKKGSEQDSKQDGVLDPVLTFSSKSTRRENEDGVANPVPQRVLRQSKLNPTRGKLFSYKISRLPDSKNYFFDCGFGIFTKADETLPRALRKENQIVSVTKNSSTPSSANSRQFKKFLVKKSALQAKKIHTYKAALNRVIDGDTILVTLDLGFEIFHQEKLRLAKINAPEANTSAGKHSTKILQEILKDQPFLIVKTNKTDIYGRYVADVFLPQKKLEKDWQKTADEGIYLNQLLLDRGVVEVFGG